MSLRCDGAMVSSDDVASSSLSSSSSVKVGFEVASDVVDCATSFSGDRSLSDVGWVTGADGETAERDHHCRQPPEENAEDLASGEVLVFGTDSVNDTIRSKSDAGKGCLNSIMLATCGANTFHV